MITFACANCQKKLQVPDEAAGKKGKCPSCGGMNTIPAVSRAVEQPVQSVLPKAGIESNALADLASRHPVLPEAGFARAVTGAQAPTAPTQSPPPSQVTGAPPPAGDAGSVWYCQMNNQQIGPVPAEKILGWLAEGSVSESVLIWRDGMSAWQPLSEIPELRGGSVAGVAKPAAGTSITPQHNLARTASSGPLEYKVLSQKDKWLSSKFDPAALERALNAYSDQGWRVRTGDTASFPGILSGKREELITILEREVGGNMSGGYEYKVLTQKDKWLSKKFDPQRLEQALNAYAEQGWNVVYATTATFPGILTGNREELVVIMERLKA